MKAYYVKMNWFGIVNRIEISFAEYHSIPLFGIYKNYVWGHTFAKNKEEAIKIIRGWTIEKYLK